MWGKAYRGYDSICEELPHLNLGLVLTKNVLLQHYRAVFDINPIPYGGMMPPPFYPESCKMFSWRCNRCKCKVGGLKFSEIQICPIWGLTNKFSLKFLLNPQQHLTLSVFFWWLDHNIYPIISGNIFKTKLKFSKTPQIHRSKQSWK